MLENGVFNRPYVRDITKIFECACSMNCDKNATELRPDRNPDIITNADRIRDMSDWELAVAAVRYEGTVVTATRYGGHDHKFYGPHGEPCANKEQAILMWFNWLQQPAEEDI